MNAHRGQTVFDTDAVPLVQAPDLQGSGVASLQVRVWSYVGGARVRRWGMAEPMLPDDSPPTLRSRDEREKLTPPSARPEAEEILGDYVQGHRRWPSIVPWRHNGRLLPFWLESRPPLFCRPPTQQRCGEALLSLSVSSAGHGRVHCSPTTLSQRRVSAVRERKKNSPSARPEAEETPGDYV